MQLRISTKLFLAILSTAFLAVTAMGVAANWNLTRGFLGYVNGLAAQEIEEVLPRLERAYAHHGSWEFLRGNPDAWMELTRVPPMPWNESSGRPEILRGVRPPLSHLTGAMLRWVVLDLNGEQVGGFPNDGPFTRRRPILVQGEVVGYAAIVPFQSVAATGAERFHSAQLAASVSVAFTALVLAALIAYRFAKALLRPVREVAQATSRLAAGDYSTRVHVRGKDEVGALARDFNRMAETLQNNARLRHSFFTDVSHELRTPLTILKGELEALEDGVRPLTQDAIRSLRNEAEVITQLVNDLHELALADSGSLTYRMQQIDLIEVLRECLTVFANRLKDHHLELHVELPNEPVYVEADERRLAQVFHNLLENALRYTDAPGQVRVKAYQWGEEAVVDVQDSPPGVPESLIDSLFNRFHRHAGARAKVQAGSGLGLAICRAVVDAHRGTVRAQPSALGGLKVTLKLPAVVRNA